MLTILRFSLMGMLFILLATVVAQTAHLRVTESVAGERTEQCKGWPMDSYSPLRYKLAGEKVNAK